MRKSLYFIFSCSIILCTFFGFKEKEKTYLRLNKNSHISIIGGNLGSRMTNFGHFETELHLRYPDSTLVIRNMCDGGDTPGFRPHASRFSPWAFPGAEKFQTEYANPSDSEGHFETADQWLHRLESDIIIAFFGFSSSFQGEKGLQNFKDELNAFVIYTLSQKYNQKNAPQLALISPMAYEKLQNSALDLPDGIQENKNLEMYTKAIEEVANQHNILFKDLFHPSLQWYEKNDADLSIDGVQLNNQGYQILAKYLSDQLFGENIKTDEGLRSLVHEAVMEKNWMWLNDFKIPNGVHAYGRRYNPFGPDNYPYEIKKIREMTAIRDKAIFTAAQYCQRLDVNALDKQTTNLPAVSTNYNPEKNGDLKYLYGQDALKSIKMAPGYKIELFASEAEFPDLANPAQMSFDNKGRLWVATMPSYPHYKPGDGKPDDKLIILEDTDNDGKADKQIVFARGLHLPVGFEISHEGVYISQGTNLKLYTDTDGDDHADKVEILLSGFDDHDTHHNSSAFCADPSGAIYSGEGVFLHTNVETAYGTVRATNGGFYRFNPKRRHLERTAQLAIPNPWGIAFDDWGQNFFAETSSPDVRWMLPGTVLPRYGQSTHKSKQLIEKEHMVRPTSGLEFVSSRHFPDEVQGDMLINNTIGFLGMKQHAVSDDGTGFSTKFRQDLFVSSDRNFRPVDMEFAPDGSLFIIDWHNILIGHMQHNARDPLRDHVHGRVYRITYPSRPLVKPAKVANATVEELLENLKLPEYRTKYRTRRELRGRSVEEVLPKLKIWVAQLNQNNSQYEKYLTEALWVSWGMNKLDLSILTKTLNAKDYRARAAAVRVIRYMGHQLPNQTALLKNAASDPNPRVRLEAIVAASWLKPEDGNQVLATAQKYELDDWMLPAYETAQAHLNGKNVNKPKEIAVTSHLKGKDLELYTKGREIFGREGFCITCHQADGKGLQASGFPPLAGTEWVTGSPERITKIVLHGLIGPLEVNKAKYPGQVPMTPYKGLLNDEEIAAVITYVRNSFGNKAEAIYPEFVKTVRAKTKSKKDFYTVSKLLKEHPLTLN